MHMSNFFLKPSNVVTVIMEISAAFVEREEKIQCRKRGRKNAFLDALAKLFITSI